MSRCDRLSNEAVDGFLTDLVAHSLATGQPLQHVALHVGGSGATDARALGKLGTLPHIRSAVLGFRGSHVSAAMLQSLVGLRSAPHLEDATIDLRDTNLADADLPALAELCTLRHLHVLLQGIRPPVDPRVLLGLCRALYRSDSRLLTLHLHLHVGGGCPVPAALGAIQYANPRLHVHRHRLAARSHADDGA